jgi:type IV secretory pathway TrbF-like protein
MNFSTALARFNYLFIRRPSTDTENPYLNARRTWNLHVGTVIYSRFAWQMVAMLCLLITLAAVGGVIKIGSLSKFTPFIYEVDRFGRTSARGPAEPTTLNSNRVIEAAVGDFIADARLVTPDVALQRKAIDRVYAKLTPDDAARTKMSAWHNDNDAFTRAEKVVVSIEHLTVLRQSDRTLQVEWTESIFDRKGSAAGPPLKMRALVTYRQAQATPETTEEEMWLNPALVFISDFSWTQVR